MTASNQSTDLASALAIKAQLEAWLQAAPDGCYAINDDGVVLFANPKAEEIFGYGPGELIGESAVNLLHRSDPARGRAILEEYVAHQESLDPLGYELLIIRRDGEKRLVHVSVGEVSRQIDSDVRWSVVVRDITESRLAEEALLAALRRSNDELARFASTTSHDLQGPLRTVAGMLYIAMHDISDQLPPEHRERLQLAMEAAERMQVQIRDLLALSKMRGGQAEPVSITDTVDGIVKTLTNDIENSAAAIRVEGNAMVYMDPAQLRQILQNLIENSLVHRSPEREPAIEVRSRKLRPGLVEVTVTDNGRGIPPNQLTAVFAEHHQLGITGGSGLGLTLVKRMVESVGGEVRAESDGRSGTCIRLLLPSVRVGF